MDDSKRFIARRGTHGEWHWQETPPGPRGPSPLSRLRGAVSKGRAAAARSFRSAIAGLSVAPGRLRRPGAPQQAPDVESTSTEPPNGWAPLPEPTSVPPAPSNAPVAHPDVPLRNLRQPELAKTRSRVATIRESLRAPLAVFACLVLAAIVAVAAIVVIETFDGGSSSGGVLVGNVTKTPASTETMSPTATRKPSPGATPSTARPSTETPSRQTPAPQTAPPTAVIPTTSPQGPVSVAYWANRLNEWWFGYLTDRVANYEEGQDIPFTVRWNGVAGATYWLRIVYDCQTPNTLGAIDYLSGLQDWGREPLAASYGPGTGRPDAAIPVPDTPNFDPDNNNAAVLTLYGAKFPVRPLPPTPGDNCDLQRTLNLPIQAAGGPITLLASGHLGTASVYSSGKGASAARIPFGLHITVDGVGRADVMVDPSAIANIER
jgi:hypothetical protein